MNNLKNKAKSLLKLLFFAVIVAFLFEQSVSYGFVGIILLILGMSFFRIWTQRDQFLLSIRDIESRVWGKPLDKDLWEKGELKNKKIKFKFRKGKSNGN